MVIGHWRIAKVWFRVLRSPMWRGIGIYTGFSIGNRRLHRALHWDRENGFIIDNFSRSKKA